MSFVDKVKKVVAGVTKKVAEAATLANPIKIDSGTRYEREGAVLFAYIKVGEIEAKERIPLDIEKWSETRKSAYLDQVIASLVKKLPLAAREQVAPTATTARVERRAAKARARRAG